MFKRKRPRDTDEDNPLARRVAKGDDSPTDPLVEASAAPTRVLGEDNEPETRILADATSVTPGDALADPPVGILLVISGPGRGRLLSFGYGMNTIGRGAGQRVRLDVGDDRVSREDHARIVYDPVAGRFHLMHGGGPNLTYRAGEPVLEPVELHDGDRITLGDTHLLFRALVGPDFDWNAPAP